MPSYIVAQHNSDGRLILTVCDSDIHGKKFEEEGVVLDLASGFYKGEERDMESAGKLMLRAYTIHAVGKKSVGLAISLGLAAKNDAKAISGVPHIQILMI